MPEQVQTILDWYRSENPGVLTNLVRLLNHGRLAGSGKLVIYPVDQGFEHGPGRSFAPNPAGYDPHYHFQLAIEAGCNAYAGPLGFLEAGAADFAGQIPLILKPKQPRRAARRSEPSWCTDGHCGRRPAIGLRGHRLHHLSRHGAALQAIRAVTRADP